MSDMEENFRKIVKIDLNDKIVMAVILPGESKVILTVKMVSGNVRRINITLDKNASRIAETTHSKTIDEPRISPVECVQIEGDLILMDIIEQATREIYRVKIALLILALENVEISEKGISKEQLKIVHKVCSGEYTEFIISNGEVSIILRKVVKLSGGSISMKQVIDKLQTIFNLLLGREKYFNEVIILEHFLGHYV